MSKTISRRTATLTPSQLGLVHLAVKQLGMDAEAYRSMLKSVAGVSSARDLDAEGFDRVMQHLTICGFAKAVGRHEASGFVARKERWRAELGERPGMATPGQLASIETEWGSMQWYWAREGTGNRELALRGFLKKRFRVADLRFLTFSQAAKAIMAIKAIQTRRHCNG